MEVLQGVHMEIIENPARRIPLNINVDIKKNYSRRPTQGVLKNISVSGAFLRHGENELQVGDKLTLEFKVSGRSRKVQSRVIWVNSHGCGINFLPMNNRDTQIVDDLMYFVESKREDTKSVLENIFAQVS